MLLLKMAFRNIFRQRRRSALTALTMMGSFYLTSVVIGFENGTYENVINTFTNSSYGQVKIHHSTYLERATLYATIENWEELSEKISEDERVISIAPRIYGNLLFSSSNRTALGSITGISPQLEERSFNFSRDITEGDYLKRSGTILLSESLAQSLRASTGDTLFVLGQASDGSIANELYEIGGIVSRGSQEDRFRSWLSLEDMQDLFFLDGQVHELAISSKNGVDSRELAASINRYLPDRYRAFPWQEFLASFYSAMKADKAGSNIFLLIIIALAGAGILNTVLMAVLERQREYGLLKALGTTPLQVALLIMMEMITLSVMSIGVASIPSLITHIYLTYVGITLSEPMSFGGMDFTTMRGTIALEAFVIPAIVVLAVTTLVSIPPAIRASKTTPKSSMQKH